MSTWVRLGNLVVFRHVKTGADGAVAEEMRKPE